MFAATNSSPIFVPKNVNHKNEKVRRIVLIKILKLILNILLSFLTLKISEIFKDIFDNLFKKKKV